MLTAEQVLTKEYLEARCMLVELAAILDRCGRSEGEPVTGDPRWQQLQDALDLLADRSSGDDRAERLLRLFSDVD
ncbi:MAG: hypothetical protein KDA79_20250 [Planctomycetaceae bacterium]|nr:hypothetical protein [Planctomycetaceae bacterium]